MAKRGILQNLLNPTAVSQDDIKGALATVAASIQRHGQDALAAYQMLAQALDAPPTKEGRREIVMAMVLLHAPRYQIVATIQARWKVHASQVDKDIRWCKDWNANTLTNRKQQEIKVNVESTNEAVIRRALILNQLSAANRANQLRASINGLMPTGLLGSGNEPEDEDPDEVRASLERKLTRLADTTPKN